MTKFPYRPEIDGLRAIAILAVLAFHFDLGLSGGFVGVDVFFVISGYLITSQIVNRLSYGTFSLADFYRRRIRRILPAALVMVAATGIVFHFLLVPADYREFGQSLLAQAFFGANFYFFRESDYFSHGGIPRPLLHCWSLAVEEQFYFVFPILLLVLFGLKRLFGTCMLVLVFTGSLIASVHFTHHSPSGAFYLLPTRAWELLIGGIVAMLEFRTKIAISDRLKNGFCFAGLGLTLSSMALFDQNTAFPGWMAGLPCLGAIGMIMASSGQSSLLGNILRSSPFVTVGMISYSLYLWHWPIVEIAKIVELTWATNLHPFILIVSTFALAFLSWRFVEQPIRKCEWTARRLIGLAASISLILAGIGFIIHTFDGFPKRLPLAARQYAEGLADNPPNHELSVVQVREGETIQMGVSAPNEATHVLLWGDSHAKGVFVILDKILRDRGKTGEAVIRNASLPVVDYSYHPQELKREQEEDYNQAVMEYIANRKIDIIVLAARWDYYLRQPHYDGEQVRLAIAETVNRLSEIVSRIIIVEQVPEPGVDVPRYLAYRSWRNPGVDLGTVPIDLGQGRQEEFFAQFSGRDEIGIMDTGSHFLDANRTRLRISFEGRCLFFDDNHLSIHGALQLLPSFEEVL